MCLSTVIDSGPVQIRARGARVRVNGTCFFVIILSDHTKIPIFYFHLWFPFIVSQAAVEVSSKRLTKFLHRISQK